MTRWIAAIVVCLAGACAMPVHAASQFVAAGQGRMDMVFATDGARPQALVKIPSASVELTSADDVHWQLTDGSCLLDFDASSANQTPEDVRYRKSFEAGFAGADNPGHEALLFIGKASVAGQTAKTSEPAIACDARHLYWVSLVRVPRTPGYLAVQLIIMDGYRPQTAEQRIIFFKAATFLTGDKRTASDIGGVAAAIAQAISK